MSRIFLPFYFNNDTSLCYRPVLNQIPFLIKELMSKKTASVFTDREEPLKKAIFEVMKKQRGRRRKSCMSLKLSRGKPGHRMKFWPLKPKIKAHGGTVWDQLISWAGSRQFQDFLRTGTHCVCVSVCVTMWRQAVQTPLFSTNISICHTPLGCKKGKKKKSIYHSAAVVQDSLYYQLHTIPTKPCERKGTVAVRRRSDPVIYSSSVLCRRCKRAGICVRLDHPCWISPQMFFALEARVAEQQLLQRAADWCGAVITLLYFQLFPELLNRWGRKKKIRALRGSAAIPICLPVKMFFVFFHVHICWPRGEHAAAVFFYRWLLRPFFS